VHGHLSYQVLARKWRPQTFEAVVGQDAITRTLRNALASGRLAHAYLFAGPRGVGKTTTARLLAKALLCPERKGPEPCGACAVCREATAGTLVDVIEIDGASNRGIEEIRTLRENVKYAPARGRYKVYIIDEVHMLTEPAFNALPTRATSRQRCSRACSGSTFGPSPPTCWRPRSSGSCARSRSRSSLPHCP
jgi:DNA polymerase III subunit gamma/tau